MKKCAVNLTIISILLVFSMIISLTACTMRVGAENLMQGITPNEITVTESLNDKNEAVTDFAVRLFKAGKEDEKNTLISPLSALCALAMTANGAQNETLKQMEKVLGMKTEELNHYLHSYINTLPKDEKNKLSLANSIWYNADTRFTANKNFLQTNADYYGADIYKAPFNDQTCKDINNWVNKKTDKMIPEILDEIPKRAVMYLVNALAFEAEWSSIYEKDSVQIGLFTKEDGTDQETEFMHSFEGVYLEDQKATGFIKYYKGAQYAFVAMLPNENISISEYVASLNGKTLSELLSKPQYTTVKAAIPKFETEYDTEMSGVLTKMGMPDAFDENKANFRGLGTSIDGNIFINRVLHKTFISVGEKGTKAGAATAVEMTNKASSGIANAKEIYLDRPFVYMLIDCKNNIPFFIGTMMNIKS